MAKINLSDITAQELMLRGERLVEKIKAVAGFDKVTLRSVELDVLSDGSCREYKIWVILMDNFQDNLSYEVKVMQGNMPFIYDLDDSDPQWPPHRPLREERELEILHKTSPDIAEFDKHMKTAVAKGFVTLLLDAQKQAGLRIKDMREEREHNEA